MGVKQVFKLTTVSDKSICTTRNYCNLAKQGRKKVVELSVGDETAVPKEDYFSAVLSYDENGNDQNTLESEQRPEL